MDYVDKYGVEFSDDRTILYRCPKNLKGSYTVPDGVKVIQDLAFIGCNNLVEVNIPDSVEEIEFGAFEGIPNINYYGKAKNEGSYVGPHYGAYALNGYIDGDFVYSDSSRSHLIYCLKRDFGIVTIPACVKSIGEYAFYDCYNITHIHVEKGNLNFYSKEGVLFNKDKTELIKFPTDFDMRYPSIMYRYFIPDSVERIRNWAFSNSRLQDIFIPNSIKEIEESAFAHCGLHVVSYGGTLEEWCTKSWKLDIDYGYILSIRNVNFTNLIVPNTLSYISNYAFYKCNNLQSVKIPGNVKKIGRSAFESCMSLHSINLSEGLEVIGESAFHENLGLNSLILPNSVKEIQNNAFFYTGLNTIGVPKGQIDRFLQMVYLNDKYSHVKFHEV